MLKSGCNRTHTARILSRAVLFTLATSNYLHGQIAFPEAEGFGANATGGRGGEVYHVTNLNDSGTGSLRAGLLSVPAGGRTIVFDVGGWIELSSALPAASNVTIAGQTAPGQGIGLKNYGLSLSGRSNVIVRHIRSRQGPYMDAVDKDAVGADSANNIILDHVSASWGRDETLSIKNSTNVTIQNSIIAEGLYNHSMGGLIEWNNGISIHHSLYMNNNDRNPKTKGILDFVNNVVYNWGAYAYVAGDSAGLSYGNVVGNYFIAGPSSTELNDPISRGNANYSMYMDGNWWDGNRNGVLDGHLLTQAEVDDVLTYVPNRFNYPQITTDTAQRAYEKVLAGAGASISRDYTDQRLINLVQTQTGAIINDPAQVGGWGSLTGGVAPTDTDQDGMPNTWETAKGLNPNDAADRNSLNLFGYTRLEEYLNELGGGHAQKIWNASGGNWQSNPSWAGAQPTVDDYVFVRGEGVGTNGNVVINQTGAEAWDLRIGGNGAAAGEKVTVATGGDLKVRSILTVGYENNGIFEMTGGVATAPNVVIGSYGQTGTLILSGGTLKTKFIAIDGAGGSVQMDGGTIQANGAMTITAPMTINLNGGTVDTNGNTATISSVISGNGPLNKTGTGDLVLSNTNTYTGGTILTGGTLSISDHNQIGGSASQITFNGGLLRVTDTTIPSISGHAVNWSTFNGGIDVADPVNTFYVSSSLAGSGSFTKAGAGTLVMQNPSTYTGGTTIAGGVLSVAFDSFLGDSAGALNLAGGTLRFSGLAPQTVARLTSLTSTSTIDIPQAATVTMSQPFTGSGSISKTGIGTLILSSANTYAGQTTVAAGTLKITNANALQNSTVNLAGGTLDLNNLNANLGGLAGTGNLDIKFYTLTIGGSNQNSTYSGNIFSSSGVGYLVKVGTGAIDLSGNNTYLGGTTLNNGTLGITTDSNIGSSANSPVTFNGGMLRINGTTLTSMGTHVVNWTTFNGGFDIANAGHTFTVSSNISGSGSMTVAGSGVLSLTGTNSFTGGTFLKSGTLSVSTPNNYGGSTKAITFSGGTLRTVGTSITDLNSATVNWSTFNGGFDISTSGAMLTVSQSIGGTGSLSKLGAGILYLSSANTFTGDTILTAGSLRIGNINALQNSTLVPNGGTLALQSITSANIGGLKGSGALSLTGVTINVGSNNQSSSYSGAISSSSGGALNKAGTGTLTLSGSSSFNGPITIQNGVLASATFPNASTNGSLGFGGSASSLIIDGGTLQYIGTSTATSSRLFSVGPNGGTLECAAAGPLKLTGTGSIGMTGTGDRTLTLAGVNADCEFKFAMGNPTSGKASLRKIDGGRWIMSGAANSLTYSGDTIIEAGILIPTAASNLLPHGTGKGNLVMIEGQFEMNNRDLIINGLIGGGNVNQRGASGTGPYIKTLTVGDADAGGEFHGTLSNTSGLTSQAVLNFSKIGTGTQILSGRNTYTGTTSVIAGVLKINGTHETLHSDYIVTGGLLEINGKVSTTNTPAAISVSSTGLLDINTGGLFRSSALNSTNAITNDGSLITTTGGSISGIAGSGLLQTTGGTLNVATGVRQNQLSISGSSIVNIASASNSAGVSQIKSLNIASNGSGDFLGKLELNNNDLVVDYTAEATPYSAVVNMVQKGLTLLGGNGMGIASQSVDAQMLAGSMLAVVDNGLTGGQITSTSGYNLIPVDSVIVKYTWFGDSNLDGVVDGSDYALIDTGFTSGGALGSWLFGDYDYNGAVDGSDYALIDTGFLSQTGSLPEPSILGVIGLAAAGLSQRRRTKPLA